MTFNLANLEAEVTAKIGGLTGSESIKDLMLLKKTCDGLNVNTTALDNAIQAATDAMSGAPTRDLLMSNRSMISAGEVISGGSGNVVTTVQKPTGLSFNPMEPVFYDMLKEELVKTDGVQARAPFSQSPSYFGSSDISITRPFVNSDGTTIAFSGYTDGTRACAHYNRPDGDALAVISQAFPASTFGNIGALRLSENNYLVFGSWSNLGLCVFRYDPASKTVTQPGATTITSSYDPHNNDRWSVFQLSENRFVLESWQSGSTATLMFYYWSGSVFTLDKVVSFSSGNSGAVGHPGASTERDFCRGRFARPSKGKLLYLFKSSPSTSNGVIVFNLDESNDKYVSHASANWSGNSVNGAVMKYDEATKKILFWYSSNTYFASWDDSTNTITYIGGGTAPVQLANNGAQVYLGDGFGYYFNTETSLFKPFAIDFNAHTISSLPTGDLKNRISIPISSHITNSGSALDSGLCMEEGDLCTYHSLQMRSNAVNVASVVRSLTSGFTVPIGIAKKAVSSGSSSMEVIATGKTIVGEGNFVRGKVERLDKENILALNSDVAIVTEIETAAYPIYTHTETTNSLAGTQIYYGRVETSADAYVKVSGKGKLQVVLENGNAYISMAAQSSKGSGLIGSIPDSSRTAKGITAIHAEDDVSYVYVTANGSSSCVVKFRVLEGAMTAHWVSR